MKYRGLFLIFSIVLLLAFSGCDQKPVRKFEFETFEDGVTFASDTGPPLELVKGFSIMKKVVVLTEIYALENSQNRDIFNLSAIPIYAIVSGNDKNAIQFINFMESGETKKCSTNFGNVLEETEFPDLECAGVIQSFGKALIIELKLPDSALEKAYIELADGKATVHARSPEEQAMFANTLAEKIYPNAKEVLKGASEKLKELK